MKIKIHFYLPEYKNYKLHFIKQFYDSIEKFKNHPQNILQLTNLQDADWVVTSTNQFNEKEYKDKKVIMVSTADAAGSFNRGFFIKPNVKYIIEHDRFKDVTEFNKPIIRGRRNYWYMNTVSNIYNKTSKDYCVPRLLTDEQLKKSICLSNTSKLYESLYDKKVKSFTERKYDIVFLGTTVYGDNIVSKHRQDIVNFLKRMQENKKELNILYSEKRIKKNDYFQILKDTKIFISPWGYGEFSLKDYECIAKGCLVFKPHIYCETYPNIYNHFIEFNIDNSDLEDKLLSYLKNPYESQKIINASRKCFRSYDVLAQFLEFQKLITDYDK